MSVDKTCSSKWLKLRNSLIDIILSKKEKLCPSVEFAEYYVSPSQLGLLSRKSLSQLTVFEMKSVSRSVMLQSKFVHDVNRTEKILTNFLPLADPYLFLHPAYVQPLFDSNKANRLVLPSLLKEVRTHITDFPFPENMTYFSLRKQLNRLSVFAGRDPMVSEY